MQHRLCGSAHPAGLASLASPRNVSRPSPPPRVVCVRAHQGPHDGSGPSSSSSSIPDSLPLAADSDWRAFRARLVASSSGTLAPNAQDEAWAHAIPSPEPGCLLLASPLYFQDSQTYFDKAVILIVEHGPNGTVGLIVNKPTLYRVGEVSSSNLGSGFDPCTLYLGGDVSLDAVNLLHGIPNVPHSHEVVPGLYIGGFDSVAPALKSGDDSVVRPESVKVLTRYAGWAPGQLDDEVRRGVWFVAAASRHFALQHVAQGAGENVWHAVLQLMGGEYAKLSAAMVQDISGEIEAAAGLGARMAQAGEGEAGEQGNGSQDMNKRREGNEEHDGSGI